MLATGYEEVGDFLVTFATRKFRGNCSRGIKVLVPLTADNMTADRPNVGQRPSM